MESQVIDDLVNNINNKKISSNDDKFEKKNLNEKNICKAAVKITTYGVAYENRLNNKEVYLVKEKVKGMYKTSAYIRCSKTSPENCTFCHIHERMNKLNNSGIKIFEEDIIPKDSGDKTKWLANLKDDFFDNMRKKKKKNDNNTFSFSNEADPVLLILNNKNSKICTMLYNYATQLLKDIDIKENSKKSNKKEKIDKQKSISENILDSLDNNSNIENIIEKESKSNIEKNDEVNEIDEVDEIEEETESISEKEINNSSESENESESEEELEPDDEIYTNDGQQLYIKDMNVYKPDEDSGCTEIGILIEISEKHHTVKYNDKLYSIFHKDTHNRKGDVYICIITNKVFNKKMKYIGKADKLSNNKYNLSFLDEI